jgi:hypothetical protein
LLDDFLGARVFDVEFVGPLAGGGVEGFLLFTFRVEGGGEGVLFARDPALAAVVDFGGVAGRGLDVGGAVELDVGGAGYEAFDVEGGEGDEVVFVVLVDVQDCVADLLGLLLGVIS